jgi:hypothetical protein
VERPDVARLVFPGRIRVRVRIVEEDARLIGEPRVVDSEELQVSPGELTLSLAPDAKSVPRPVPQAGRGYERRRRPQSGGKRRLPRGERPLRRRRSRGSYPFWSPAQTRQANPHGQAAPPRRRRPTDRAPSALSSPESPSRQGGTERRAKVLGARSLPSQATAT